MAAKIPMTDLLQQAGINPKTGLPTRFKTDEFTSKDDIKKVLRIIDEQDAVNCGTWYNLPCNITSQELERMLYYKGQLAFFYLKDLDQFFFMPYALDGTIDFYGRFNTIHPVPMSGGTDDKTNKAQADYLAGIKLNCVYGYKTELTEDDLYNSCVLLHDYTKQLSETIIPRQQLNDPILDNMSECLPMMRTALINSVGTTGVRVSDADQAMSLSDANRQVSSAAIRGEKFIPVVGSIDFQELSTNNSGNAQDYLLAMQALDNLRLSTYGIDNGGLFEKKAHELQSEADLNSGPIGLVLQDRVSIRQDFCNIVNSIWGLGIWYEPAENISKVDLNGDGVDYNRNTEGENSGRDSSDSMESENV